MSWIKTMCHWLRAPHSLEDLPGIGPSFADRLRDAGITSPTQFLNQISSADGVADLSHSTGLAQNVLRHAAGHKVAWYLNYKITGLLAATGTTLAVLSGVHGVFQGNELTAVRTELQGTERRLSEIRESTAAVPAIAEQMNQLSTILSTPPTDPTRTRFSHAPYWGWFADIDVPHLGPTDTVVVQPMPFPDERIMLLASDTSTLVYRVRHSGTSLERLADWSLRYWGAYEAYSYSLINRILVDGVWVDVPDPELIVQGFGGAAGGSRDLMVFLRHPVNHKWVEILSEGGWEAEYTFGDLEGDGSLGFIVQEQQSVSEEVEALPVPTRCRYYRWNDVSVRFEFDPELSGEPVCSVAPPPSGEFVG